MSRRIKKKPRVHDYDRLSTAIEYYREKIGVAAPEALVIFNDLLGDLSKRLGEESMRRVKYDAYTDPFINNAVTFKFDRGEIVMAVTNADHGSASLIDMADEYVENAPYLPMVEFLRQQQFKTVEDARKYLGKQDSLLGTYLAYHGKTGDNYELVSSFLEGVAEITSDEDDEDAIYMLPKSNISLRCVLMVGRYIIVFAFNEAREVTA